MKIVNSVLPYRRMIEVSLFNGVDCAGSNFLGWGKGVGGAPVFVYTCSVLRKPPHLRCTSADTLHITDRMASSFFIRQF